MNPVSRLINAVTGSDEPAAEATPAGPAAASGDTQTPSAPLTSPDDSVGERSQGPSGFSDAETTTGGADAVPDTPDGVPESYT